MVRIGEENQVKFADVAGLEQAKQTFRDAIILPSLMPDFFKVHTLSLLNFGKCANI